MRVPAPLRVVAESTPTINDFGLIEARLNQLTAFEEKQRNIAFAELVLRDVFGVDENDIKNAIVDGKYDRGIDLVVIDHDDKIIHFGSCKCVANFKNSKKNFPGEEVDKILSFFHDILHKREDMLDEVNPGLAVKIRETWDILESDPYTLRIHLFSNQAKLAPAERDRLNAFLNQNAIQLVEQGLYELAHGVARPYRPHFRKKISPIKADALRIEGEGLRSVGTAVALSQLATFVTDKDGSFDERLLSHNVRLFLGNSNEVNAAIRETLLGGDQASFYNLNNGVTIVCDQILGSQTGHLQMTLVNPKIINGGQTARVVHECSTTLTPLTKGEVAIKIIETRDEELIEKIAIATNSQSRILGRDLRAFNAFQAKLAAAISMMGFFYRRKRGETAAIPSSHVIDMAKAGQLLLAYAGAEPTLAKTNSNDIFGDLYERAFDPSKTTAELIVSAFICHQEIETLRQSAIAEQKLATRSSFEESWVVEGHLHLLFAVGELMRREGKSLTDFRAAIELISKARDALEIFVRANPKVASYRLFRLASSKGAILNAIDGIASPTSAYPVQTSFDFRQG